MKTHWIASLAFVLLNLAAEADDSAVVADIAPPKKGVQVAPPLSANPPSEYTGLPYFGSITWETRRLPWVEGGPYAGISGVAMATHNGEIYVAGGFIPGGDETDDANNRRTSRWTWKYTQKTESWERLANVPVRREYTRGIVSGDAFYLVGGGKISKGQTPPYRAYGDCFVLNLTQDTPSWRKHSLLNVPRTHTAIGSVNNLLLVVGGNEYDFDEKGYSHRTIRDTTEVFDLTHPDQGWQRRSPIPTGGRGWSASVVADEHLFLFGGVSWNPQNAAFRTQETWRYDPQADDWQAMTPPPLPISGWEAGLYNDRYALITGGVTQSSDQSPGTLGWSDLTWAYDCHDNQWLRVNAVLPPGAVFNDPGVVVIDDTIYILGAEGPSGSHYNYFLVGTIDRDVR